MRAGNMPPLKRLGFVRDSYPTLPRWANFVCAFRAGWLPFLVVTNILSSDPTLAKRRLGWGTPRLSAAVEDRAGVAKIVLLAFHYLAGAAPARV